MQKSFTILGLSAVFIFGTTAPVFAADTTSPIVSAITPVAVKAGVSTSFSASFSDNVGVTYCEAIEGNILLSSHVLGSTIAGGDSFPYAFANPGMHSIQMRCRDAANNWGFGPMTTIQVDKNDVTAPIVSAINPSSAIAGVGTTFSASYSDSESTVSLCRLVDGGAVIWTGSPFVSNAMSGSVSLTQSFGVGIHTLEFQCRDDAGNWGHGVPTAVNVVSAIDTTPPSIGNVFASVDEPTAGATVWYYVNGSDNVGISYCRLFLNSSLPVSPDVGIMSLQASGSYALKYVFPQSATDIAYSAQARCYDAAGNSSLSPGLKYFTLHHSQIIDYTAPMVGAIQQKSVVSGVSTNITASVNGVISSCSLIVNGVNVGYANVTNGLVSKNYIFNTSTYVRFECFSPDGHVGSGSNTYLNVSASSSVTPNFVYGTLIKLGCPSYAAADHPCKAVYYFGADGKRHPFPNSKVYFSWYAGFGGVQEISDTQMAAIPLGSSVRYRPGVRMVKFTTLPKVYAVAGNGTLRWITNEALARAFYTTKWNEQIDDIPDTFFANYRFGSDINAVSEYNPEGERNMAPTIDANL